MRLDEYIKSYPRWDRRQVRERIAKAANVSLPAVKHWENGTRNIPSAKLRAVSEACGDQVPIEDLLPIEAA